MIYRDPKCVFVANNTGEAAVMVAVLEGADIPAQVMNPATLGGLVGLTPLAPSGVSSLGIEIWVLDVNQAEQARQLVAEQAERVAAREARAANAPERIEVVCDECDKINVFPGKAQGTVQTCDECGAYLDVPGPEDEWDAEEGEETGEDA